MPPRRRSSRRTFDIDMLDPRVLATSDGLHTALRGIEEVCYRGDPEIARVISALINQSHILEYIISGTLHAYIGSCA